MVPRPSSTAAVLALLIGAGLLANPLYLHAADRGDVIVTAEPTSPADGATPLSEEIEQSEDSPPSHDMPSVVRSRTDRSR